jgi:hypothetical protein
MTCARYLSSVCSSRITSDATTFSPASIIVANCREKICSDFGLIFLIDGGPLSSSAPANSRSEEARSPRILSCSRAEARSGAWSSPVSSAPLALMAE